MKNSSLSTNQFANSQLRPRKSYLSFDSSARTPQTDFLTKIAEASKQIQLNTARESNIDSRNSRTSSPKGQSQINKGFFDSPEAKEFLGSLKPQANHRQQHFHNRTSSSRSKTPVDSTGCTPRKHTPRPTQGTGPRGYQIQAVNILTETLTLYLVSIFQRLKAYAEAATLQEYLDRIRIDAQV